MQKRQEAVANPSTGKPISGATVTVTQLSGGAAATIYTGNGTGLISGNTVTTDSNGRYSYYAADGRYSESISGTGLTTTIVTDILLEDPADGSAALSASSGASLIGFVQSGTPSASTTVALQLQKSEFFDSIASLRLWSGSITNGTFAFVANYYAGVSGGGGLFQWNSASTATENGGTVIVPTGQGATGRFLRQYDALQFSVQVFGATGNGVTNDAPFITAADTAVAARGRKGVVYFPVPSVGYNCTSTLTPSSGVEWLGEEWGWTNTAGTAFVSGVQIIKSHNNDCISIPSGIGTRITNIAIRSDKVTYTTGNGITIGAAAEVRLERVAVFTVGGDGIVTGDGSSNAYHNYATDCYVNNPGGRCFVVNSLWFKGQTLRTDGGTVACEFGSGSAYWRLGNFHFEGWTTNGIKVNGGQFGKTWGLGVINNTIGGALTAVNVANVAGSNLCTLDGLRLKNGVAYNAGSIGISFVGGNNGACRVTDFYIENYGKGVVANGADTWVGKGHFYGCGYACEQGASNLKFVENKVEATVNSQCVLFTAGSACTYYGNTLDKILSSTGQLLNDTNTAYNNQGWLTRATGTTGAIATGVTVAHGLPVQPSEVFASPVGALPAGFQYSVAWDATNVTFTFTGGGTVQFTWTAHLQCERRA